MKKNIKGTILPALLVVGTAFVIVIYGILFVLTLQFDFANRQTASESALNIAEAGVNYYRWHLSHDPDDFQDGGEDEGPYEHEYFDPEGDSIGTFSLVITPPSEGSSIVTITSTGWIKGYPNIRRTVKAQYGKRSLARYAFLSNASNWYGTGSVINGMVHSNTGVRMDGTNNSLVTSAQEEYQCGSETGCDPPTKKPGVWGSGGDQGLWQFPVPAIDFDTISFDFANMKADAQSSGLYLEPSNKSGYHIVFFSDGTFNVYRVTVTGYTEGYSVPGQGLGEEGIGGCRRLYQLIDEEVFIGSYIVDENPIVFVEDDLWVEGDIKGQLTVAAANFPIVSSSADTWITDSIKYQNYDGSDLLGLVSQNNIFIVKDVPDDFHINGILTAQAGKVIRHGYFDWCGDPEDAVKDKLTVFGSIIAYYRSYWNFGSGPESGFTERELNYDVHALYNPPPYFPSTSEYEFISWIEE